MTKVVNDITKEISNLLKDDDHLLSLSLAGSFSNKKKKLESSNDLDFIIIYDKINEKNLSKLKKIARTIKKKYSSTELEVNFTFKIGPIKISSKKTKSILIHFLVYSEDSFENYESLTVRYSFQFYPPLLGKSIKEINNFSKGIHIDLFNNIDGIPARRNWINTQSIQYIQPSSGGVKITTSKLKNGVYLEVIFYSVLWLANDMLRLKSFYYPDINREMCIKFKQVFDINLNHLPLLIYNYKRALRNNKTFHNKEIVEMKSKALDFLSQCEEYLRKNDLNNITSLRKYLP